MIATITKSAATSKTTTFTKSATTTTTTTTTKATHNLLTISRKGRAERGSWPSTPQAYSLAHASRWVGTVDQCVCNGRTPVERLPPRPTGQIPLQSALTACDHLDRDFPPDPQTHRTVECDTRLVYSWKTLSLKCKQLGEMFFKDN
ncbi:hypothetical protein RRG08_016206 [Elysia crispata]|uniref:Uncharacterized protein n=1 Tax=Elysia crispata TaxID=231223 RepID=A0AAE0ZPV5_9GAST|nr:hypothetical protein RRG08_016206 [Elysia crispata]